MIAIRSLPALSKRSDSLAFLTSLLLHAHTELIGNILSIDPADFAVVYARTRTIFLSPPLTQFWIAVDTWKERMKILRNTAL